MTITINDDGSILVVPSAATPGESSVAARIGALVEEPDDYSVTGRLRLLDQKIQYISEAVAEPGDYQHAAGEGPATVTLPPDRWLTRIRVVAGLTEAATVKIGGGLVIPVPPGDVLDIPIHGRVNDQDGDVIEISGVVRSYYVAWR